jgi:hypothetical protein
MPPTAYTVGTSRRPRWTPAWIRLPNLPAPYPALVATRRRRQTNPIARVSLPVLQRLAGDTIDRWHTDPEPGRLLPVITLHDGDVHILARFGDRDTPAEPLPPDADGLYRIAGPLWPWIVSF